MICATIKTSETTKHKQMTIQNSWHFDQQSVFSHNNNINMPKQNTDHKAPAKKPVAKKPEAKKPVHAAKPAPKSNNKGSMSALDKMKLNRVKLIAAAMVVILIVAIGLVFGLKKNEILGLTSGQNNPSPGNPNGTPTNGPGYNSTPGAPLPADAQSRLKQADWSQILVSQQPDLSYKPSTIYKSDDMIKAVAEAVQYGVGSQKLWFGDGNTVYGLVTVAAFLAQSMKETIKYDACDENNWNQVNGYSAANACGQLGQAYDKYKCSGSEAGMECPIDPNKVVVATTNAKWYGAPGPLFSAPRSLVPKAPKWNYGSPWCNPATPFSAFTSDSDYVSAVAKFDNSATCRMYSGQKAGGWELCGGQACPSDAAPSFGVPARTDVEGCYFWGRGVIQTTGVCNYGKMNYFSGKRAASDGRPALFPDVDFCKTPEQVCTSTKYPELKWFSGLFYWINAVQDYDDGKYNYKAQLKDFVDSGFPNPGADTGFIRGVSGIVNRGCADPPNCGTGPLDGGAERAENFQKVLKAMKLI
jgi:predicted chitinase